MQKPNVWAITATCGRMTLLRRALACFLAQDYDGPHTLLIYNNANVPLSLGPISVPIGEYEPSPQKSIKLVNNNLDSNTGVEYTNLGAIYRDALTEVPPEANIITHWDDDDIFLPNHISEGVKGFEKAQRITDSRIEHGLDYIEYEAYKPERSYFRHASGIDLMGNNLEPSIFINTEWLKRYGYKETTTDQHFGWFGPLLEKNAMWVDPNGTPTLIYNWGDINIPTFKTSGNAGDPNNFMHYRIFSQDFGDRVISPLGEDELQDYYVQLYNSDAYRSLYNKTLKDA